MDLDGDACERVGLSVSFMYGICLCSQGIEFAVSSGYYHIYLPTSTTCAW